MVIGDAWVRLAREAVAVQMLPFFANAAVDLNVELARGSSNC